MPGSSPLSYLPCVPSYDVYISVQLENRMDDVNPLIENDKAPNIQSRLLEWKSVTVILFIKFRYRLVVSLLVMLVTVFLLVLLSFLFTGGKMVFVYFQITPAESHTVPYTRKFVPSIKVSSNCHVFPC